jgi:hypothetical protein
MRLGLSSPNGKGDNDLTKIFFSIATEKESRIIKFYQINKTSIISENIFYAESYEFVQSCFSI